ncbi:hypothetical protein SGLAM104S_05626 [Streptomyces glaucescens]
MRAAEHGVVTTSVPLSMTPSRMSRHSPEAAFTTWAEEPPGGRAGGGVGFRGGRGGRDAPGVRGGAADVAAGGEVAGGEVAGVGVTVRVAVAVIVTGGGAAGSGGTPVGLR